MYYLSRMVGTTKAQELRMLGSVLSAEEADKLGLATKVVPDPALPFQKGFCDVRRVYPGRAD